MQTYIHGVLYLIALVYFCAHKDIKVYALGYEVMWIPGHLGYTCIPRYLNTRVTRAENLRIMDVKINA
jgi:hypothetical protein